MTEIYTRERIVSALSKMDITRPLEEGFIEYSRGNVMVPPVGELMFEDPPGETHIKYGYIKGQDVYVIKIASGFYNNPVMGLSSSSGLMLVFSQKTGYLKTILLDEGFLTDVRTAVAGQIAARYLSPSKVKGIGVIGTGIQARMQMEYLKPVTSCRKLHVWGRTEAHVTTYQKEMETLGFEVFPEDSPAGVAKACNLIVTTTPSTKPLLFLKDIQDGTHITAVGSDTSHKQELDVNILENATLVIADSISQCRVRGEISKALAAGKLQESKILELGRVIENPKLVNVPEPLNSVADLTGVAVQDVQIAAAVCRALVD